MPQKQAPPLSAKGGQGWGLLFTVCIVKFISGNMFLPFCNRRGYYGKRKKEIGGKFVV